MQSFFKDTLDIEPEKRVTAAQALQSRFLEKYAPEPQVDSFFTQVSISSTNKLPNNEIFKICIPEEQPQNKVEPFAQEKNSSADSQLLGEKTEKNDGDTGGKHRRSAHSLLEIHSLPAQGGQKSQGPPAPPCITLEEMRDVGKNWEAFGKMKRMKQLIMLFLSTRFSTSEGGKLSDKEREKGLWKEEQRCLLRKFAPLFRKFASRIFVCLKRKLRINY